MKLLKEVKKYTLLSIVALLIATVSSGQSKYDGRYGGYKFTDIAIAPSTPPIGQGLTGTCWCFSGIATMESELKRMGKGEYDLSEMWIVRHAFIEKAKRMSMLRRNALKGSGSIGDVPYIIEKYGIVPESAYPGLNYGTNFHVHWELNGVVNGYFKGVLQNKNGELSEGWINGLNNILDAYLGEVPETFSYNGKEYTPQSFTQELGLNMDNYVRIASVMHVPFYKKFGLEVSGNWHWDDFYNLPLDEMIEVIDYAVRNGYSLTWIADVTNRGYSKEEGICVYPAESLEQIPPDERIEWLKYSDKEISDMGNREVPGAFAVPVAERIVTQESRQKEYLNFNVKEDHGMHIMGIAADQRGRIFYKIKNSAHHRAVYQNGGYYYASQPYMKMFTISLQLHKNGIPPHIAQKLKIE
ncbi:MAG: aminopeptidase [Bacteroidales bacterium]